MGEREEKGGGRKGGEQRSLTLSDPIPVIVYTDGACSGNPGPGGYCAILRFGPHEKVLQGGASLTTNNRMELRAALVAFQALPGRARSRFTPTRSI